MSNGGMMISKGKPKKLGEKSLFHYKSHRRSPGIEPVPPAMKNRHLTA
jgi:hypothetical protein